MGFITALQLAAVATGDNSKAAVAWFSLSLTAGSPLPCLAGLCLSVHPSSAESLRADPALPTQSIQPGARPPALGRII